MTLLKLAVDSRIRGKSLTADDADKAQHTTTKVWTIFLCVYK
jgi:hypothetical protein